MTRYAIMQVPGAQALANRAHWQERGFYTDMPRPKRAATVVIFDEGSKFALGEFVHNRYLVTGNRQYAGHRFEWRSSRRLESQWRPDDDADPGTRGRDWSVIVTLRNGRQQHETRFLAWKENVR